MLLHCLRSICCFFFFVAVVALFFLTDIIFHFCGVCVQRMLLLFLLLDVNGGWRTLSTASWHQRHRCSILLTWKAASILIITLKGDFPYLTRFCWIPGNSREVTGTNSIIENAHFLHYVKVLMNMACENLLKVQNVNEIVVWNVNNNESNQI